MSSKGVKGVLGRHHVMQAVQALTEMPRSDYRRLTKALACAGLDEHGRPVEGADAHTERALIFKAVSARTDRLKKGAFDVEARRKFTFSTPSERAIDEIIKFAGKIRGMGREHLILNTTALDTSDDPQGEDSSYGCGNYQRYINSCAPATAQNVRAERDPVFAMKIRADLLSSDSDSQTVRQQKEFVEKLRFMDALYMLIEASPKQVKRWRKDGTLPPRATQAEEIEAVSQVGHRVDLIVDPQLSEKLPLEKYEMVRKYLSNHRLTEADENLAREVIAEVSPEIWVPNLTREAVDKMSLEMVVQEIRSTYTRNDDGTSTRKPDIGSSITDALADIAPARGMQEWREIDTNASKGGLSDADIGHLDYVLEQGIDVPIGIGRWNAKDFAGHAMMISDVRGEGKSRKYLVSDPFLGKGEWVRQYDMQKYPSTWPLRHFRQPAKGIVSMCFQLGQRAAAT
jgi:hypothetical protein